MSRQNTIHGNKVRFIWILIRYAAYRYDAFEYSPPTRLADSVQVVVVEAPGSCYVRVIRRKVIFEDHMEAYHPDKVGEVAFRLVIP